MTRRFSGKQRAAVEMVSGPGEEADHVVAHSRGGATMVENCQLISGSANRRKAAFVFEPRRWQSEFLKDWEERERGCPYMLIAIPAGGKTWAALQAARRWMSAGADRRVVVVVPTDNLREQWRSEAVKFGIELQTKEFGTNFKDGFQGGATTYSMVASNSLVFRKLCSVAPTMVIFDEVHHCGDDASFGRGIKDAFELAREKLLMSGTPWKSDGQAIPFVNYDGNGFAVGNFSYDYPRALNEDVVRYLVFDYSRGSIRNELTGRIEQVSKEISEADAARRLRRILDPSGEFVRQQISLAHRKLIECRRAMPDAAALAACIDQDHAAKVAGVIKAVTGTTPSVIVSDSGMTNDSVEKFRRSKKEWLVAVRKVSEGTDIKRLQVLCYLTNTTSELFFRQLVGRVSRTRQTEDLEAYVYLPADPRLVRCAQNIENAQAMALAKESEKECRELRFDEEGQKVFDIYSTSHDGTDLVLVGGESMPVDEAKRLESIAEATGVSMNKVAQVLSMAGGLKPKAHVLQPEQSKESRMDSLRRKINKAAYRLSKNAQLDIKDVHGRFKPQKEMSESELVAKWRAIIEWERAI